jgi:hypothetical protein
MNPGILNAYAEIQSPTSAPDGNTWTTIRSQWMLIEPISANRQIFLSAQGSKVTHKVIARDLPLLVVGQRAVYDGVNYQITEVLRFRGDRQEALCEVVQ